MYLDANLMFSHQQVITATSFSNKVLCVGEEVGAGLPIFPLIQVAEIFEGINTLEVQLQSANVAKESDLIESAWQTIATSGVKTQEEINTARTINFGSLPPTSGKFLRVQYIVTGTPTKGSVSAALVLDRQI